MRADWLQGCRSSECRGTRLTGYSLAKQLLLDTLDEYAFDGIDVSGEATGYFWLPFFLQLAADPDLAPHDLNLFLLNPRWVKWFKKCFAEDDKSDQKDPFYIAERTRTRRPSATWSPPDCLPLRFYTRLRFHVVQNLAREKCYFSAFLFLKASSYRRLKPFSDVFGATSRLVLTQYPSLDQLAAIPVEDLALHLQQLSGHHLPDPFDNARKLQQVAQESFSLNHTLALPVQRILDLNPGTHPLPRSSDRPGRWLDRHRTRTLSRHLSAGYHPRDRPRLLQRHRRRDRRCPALSPGAEVGSKAQALSPTQPPRCRGRRGQDRRPLVAPRRLG